MYITDETNFLQDIRKFNAMYEHPSNEKPTLLGPLQLEQFKSILSEEVAEIDAIIRTYKEKENSLSEEEKLELLTCLADWFGDIIVYVSNEAQKHGIPLDKTLKIIMESNFSKLGEEGKILKDARGKVLKGPNYWKPESRIKEMLKRQ